MNWCIELQEKPTRCLRLANKRGAIARCWHGRHAEAILNHPVATALLPMDRLHQGKLHKLCKTEAQKLLLIAACCAIEIQLFH